MFFFKLIVMRNEVANFVGIQGLVWRLGRINWLIFCLALITTAWNAVVIFLLFGWVCSRRNGGGWWWRVMAPNFWRTGGDGERERGRIEQRTVRTGGFGGKLMDSQEGFWSDSGWGEKADPFFGSGKREIEFFLGVVVEKEGILMRTEWKKYL
jgi:hypothetical protein